MKSFNAKRFLNASVLTGLILAFTNPANAEASTKGQLTAAFAAKTFTSAASPVGPSAAKDQARSKNNPPDSKLSESQKSLMEGSKRAILKTGMSEPYFNRHFRVADVFDKPGDRRVVWKFFINEYEATINDSIGYYAEGGKRIDVHSVENTLSSTTDIRRTIPRTRALRIMRACLGRFAETAVEYRGSGSGKAGLFLTASSIPKSVPLSEKQVRESERKRIERESREGGVKVNQAGTDVIDEEEENDRPPIFIGSVNLETGRCMKGKAQAGPPKVR